MTVTLESLRQSLNALSSHYARFGVGERLLLTGHSHQAWPDVAREAQLEVFDDAARHVDEKWSRAFEKAEEVREGFRGWLFDPSAVIVLGASVHELFVRFLSSLDFARRPRIVATDGEFNSIRRQLDRLTETGHVEVRYLPSDPIGTLSERLASSVDQRTAAVVCSAVLFQTSRIVPNLRALAEACTREGVECAIDAYHALGCLPFPLESQGLAKAFVFGGGYKYLQLGEGNCFMRVPEHAAELRPVVTGWFAELKSLQQGQRSAAAAFPVGVDRFAGSTYDPTSHYRAARVFRFFREQGLTPALLRSSYQHQLGVLLRGFGALGLPPETARAPAAPLAALGGFLAIESPRAAELRAALHSRGVWTDARGPFLRFGPAPYLSDAQLEAAMAALGEVA